MRFPLRLNADLFRARILGLVSRPSSALLRFSPLVTHLSGTQRIDESSTDLEWHSPEDCIRLARNLRTPVLWIGGAEPLLHPEIGRVANALVEDGRHVFLHTSGLGLRKRVHEFRPHSRLFFAVELVGRESVHDRCTGQPGAFRRVMESIRTAKLSGFLVSAHVTVTQETDAREAGELFEELDTKDVDGFIVSSGAAGSSTALAAKLGEIRALIRSGSWEGFSKLLESSHAQPVPAAARPEFPGNQAGAFEEGD